MGDVAIWIPSTGGQAQSVKVLYQNPDQQKQLGDNDKFDYNPYMYSFEYYEGQFPTLKPLVDSGTLEIITVSGTILDVRKVVTKVDGKTYVAYCDLHE